MYESISQDYLLCVLKKNGKLPVMGTEITVCLLAGALLDLLQSRVVEVDDKGKINVVGALAGEQYFLNSLYEFLKEKKPMKADKLAGEYAFTFTGRRMKELIEGIGQALASQNRAEAGEKAGIFIPHEEAVEHVIQKIRAELLEEGSISESTVGLACLMHESKKLKDYFSKHEREQLKARLKELKSSPEHEIVRKMTEYIDTMIAVIAVTGASAGN